MYAVLKKSIFDFDLSRLLGDTFATLWIWDFRWRSRQQLADMDAHALEDIGLTAATAYAEAEKPFWR